MVDFPKMSGGLEGQAGLTTMQHLRKQILTLKVREPSKSLAGWLIGTRPKG